MTLDTINTGKCDVSIVDGRFGIRLVIDVTKLYMDKTSTWEVIPEPAARYVDLRTPTVGYKTTKYFRGLVWIPEVKSGVGVILVNPFPFYRKLRIVVDHWRGLG